MQEFWTTLPLFRINILQLLAIHEKINRIQIKYQIPKHHSLNVNYWRTSRLLAKWEVKQSVGGKKVHTKKEAGGKIVTSKSGVLCPFTRYVNGKKNFSFVRNCMCLCNAINIQSNVNHTHITKVFHSLNLSVYVTTL